MLAHAHPFDTERCTSAALAPRTGFHTPRPFIGVTPRVAQYSPACLLSSALRLDHSGAVGRSLERPFPLCRTVSPQCFLLRSRSSTSPSRPKTFGNFGGTSRGRTTSFFQSRSRHTSARRHGRPAADWRADVVLLPPCPVGCCIAAALCAFSHAFVPRRLIAHRALARASMHLLMNV